MAQSIQQLKEEIQALRQDIIQHELYDSIESVGDLAIFMEYHIFAVWDFMSLLKILQQRLTCTQVPWFPTGDPATRYLINEIVTGEESDIDEKGVRKSHYELYLDAMEQCKADPSKMLSLSEALQHGSALKDALIASKVPEAAADFVKHTFSVIEEAGTHAQAAAFTFGREDLIPDMFYTIVNGLANRSPDAVSTFKYYLDRHIEVDGDQHGNLATEMTRILCGEDEVKWTEATNAVKKALEMRIHLWNGALSAIRANK